MEKKNFFWLKILLFSLASVAGIFFNGGYSVFADINKDEADYLLSHYVYDNWISLPYEQTEVIRDAYVAGINNGLTHQQAANEANLVWHSVADSFNSSEPANRTIISSIRGLVWNFNKQDDGQIVLSPNISDTFTPTVAEQNRTFQAIINNRQYFDEDNVNNALDQTDNSQEQDNPAVDNSVSQNTDNSNVVNSLAGNQTSGQTTARCPEEGLEGVDFLFFHGPLVPCGVKKQCAGNNEGLSIHKPCTLCHFIVLIQNFFNLLLSLLIIVSIFMLTLAGVLYIISAGGKMMNLAKEIVEKTLLGFGLFLLSWLIVFTLISLLSANTSMIGKGENGIFQFTCDDDSAFWNFSDDTTHTNPDDPTHTNPDDPTHTNPSRPGIQTNDEVYGDQDARSVLIDGGIVIKDGVVVDGIKKNTADGVANVARQCSQAMGDKCNVVLTAALDGTHKNPDGSPSHYTGDKTDIRSRSTTPRLNEFLIGTSNTATASSIPIGEKVGHLTRVGTRNDDGAILFKDPEGHPWALEDQGTNNEHWDVNWGKTIQ